MRGRLTGARAKEKTPNRAFLSGCQSRGNQWVPPVIPVTPICRRFKHSVDRPWDTLREQSWLSRRPFFGCQFLQSHKGFNLGRSADHGIYSLINGAPSLATVGTRPLASRISTMSTTGLTSRAVTAANPPLPGAIGTKEGIGSTSRVGKGAPDA